MWAKAMDIMVDGRHNLTLPMPNHNYLRKVAHDLASDAAKQAESSRTFYRPAAATQPVSLQAPAPPSPPETRSEEDTQYGIAQIAKIMGSLKDLDAK